MDLILEVMWKWVKTFFDPQIVTGRIQVIMATNRIDSLDPALIRPGRIDRKIEFPLPDEKTRRMIFKIHTGRMTLGDDVNLEELIMAKDDLSGADIKVGRRSIFVSHERTFSSLLSRRSARKRV